jgi:SAM-dependent methyltransferase
VKVCLACNNRFDDSSWHCPHCVESPVQRDGFLAFAPDLADASEGFEATFFETLISVEAGNFWFESRNRLLIWALRRYFPTAITAGRFLEIGCGTGFVASGLHAAFPDMHIVGSEIFSQGLIFAQRRLLDATLLQMDARNIPFAEEFDVVGIFDVLEHIAEDQRVLSQIFQALKPGAGLILTVPQHRFLWSVADEYGHHVRRYSRGELVGKVRQAGFEITRVTSFVSLLLPLLMLSRITAKGTSETYDPLSEFRISQQVNAVLGNVMKVEAAFIRAGISFPMGSSLLLVARRPAS